jgi:hypothetical protein
MMKNKMMMMMMMMMMVVVVIVMGGFVVFGGVYVTLHLHSLFALSMLLCLMCPL